MIKLNQDYINLKIVNCKELVKNATSEAQAEIYIGYLEFWQKKLKPKKTYPDVEYNSVVYNDANYIEQYMAKFPNKKAYYKRNGKSYKTRGFKEFLKNL